MGHQQNLRSILGRRHWHTCLFCFNHSSPNAVHPLRIHCTSTAHPLRIQRFRGVKTTLLPPSPSRAPRPARPARPGNKTIDKHHIDYFSKGPKSNRTDRNRKRRSFRVNSILSFGHNYSMKRTLDEFWRGIDQKRPTKFPTTVFSDKSHSNSKNVKTKINKKMMGWIENGPKKI